MNSGNHDAVPIDQIITLAENIRQLPLKHLLPHSSQLQRLLAITEEINTAVTQAVVSHRNEHSGHIIAPSSWNSPRPSQPALSPSVTTPPTVKRSRQVSAARALQAASEIAPVLAQAIRRHTTTQLEEWCRLPSDLRALHLQPILSYQNENKHSSIDAADRLLMAASCQSLALDFALFEQSQGWTSKHQVLLMQLLNGESLAVQRHGHHHGNFFANLGDVGSHREKFDAGLRLGTKMRIIQNCAQAAGLGSTLGLLLAYECRSLSRLPYREFSELLTLLQGPRENLQTIIDFANEFDEWWLDFSNKYHSMHGRHAVFADCRNSNTSPPEPDLLHMFSSPVNFAGSTISDRSSVPSIPETFDSGIGRSPAFDSGEYAGMEEFLGGDPAAGTATFNEWSEGCINVL